MSGRANGWRLLVEAAPAEVPAPVPVPPPVEDDSPLPYLRPEVEAEALADIAAVHGFGAPEEDPPPLLALVPEDGAYDPNFVFVRRGPDNPGRSGAHIIECQSTTREEAEPEVYFRCWRRRLTGEWYDTLPADWLDIYRRNEAATLQPGWLAVLSGVGYLMEWGIPLRYLSLNAIQTGAALYPTARIYEYPARWVGLGSMRSDGSRTTTFFHTFRAAYESTEVVDVLPVYDPGHSGREISARIRIYGQTGVWPLEPLPVEAYLGERSADYDSGAAQREWLRLQRLVVAPANPERFLEWRNIEPFVQGWASMIPNVRVDFTTFDESLITITLNSTTGSERASLLLRPAEPVVGLTFDMVAHQTLAEISAHGHFMEVVADAAERLQGYLRERLAAVVAQPETP